MLACKDRCVAKVDRKGIRAPTEEPFDLGSREASGIKEDAGPNPKGMRGPFLDSGSITGWVKGIDCNGR